MLSARHVAELIVDELGAEMELIGVPASFCRGVYPLAEKSSLILEMSKARTLLGYRDVVDVEIATRITARWQRDHPISSGDLREGTIPGSGRFDYAREDAILAAWRHAEEAMTAFEAAPTR